MDRLFAVLLLAALLLLGPVGKDWTRGPEAEKAQEVFFSMLFPQLMPGAETAQREQATAPEAVYL